MMLEKFIVLFLVLGLPALLIMALYYNLNSR